MKRLLPLVAIAATLVIASGTRADADAWVDSPSFGRIVYGMTGGLVVLPESTWGGAYPDGSGTAISSAAGDSAFGGGTVVTGGMIDYTGDLFGTPGTNTGYDFTSVGGTGAVDATAVTPVFGTGSTPHTQVLATKLGSIATEGWASTISVYGTPSVSPLTTLFAAGSDAGTVSAVTTGNPFGLAYTSSVYSFAYYSDNPANNTGTAANKLYNHIQAYEVTDPTNPFYGTYFAGFEDANFNTAGNPGYHRFDYNDSVIAMTFEEVPEPAFYQMGTLLTLGALGLLWRRRRRVA